MSGSTWTVTDYLELTVAGDIFAGARGTFFGQFKRDDRFIGQLKILFARSKQPQQKRCGVLTTGITASSTNSTMN